MPFSVFEYVQELHSAELERVHALEEKLMRYQTVSAAIFGAGMFGISRVQAQPSGAPAGFATIAFWILAGIAFLAAFCAMTSTLLGMRVVAVSLPPVNQETLRALQRPEAVDELVQEFSKSILEIRKLNESRASWIQQAWIATFVGGVAGSISLVVAALLPTPGSS